MFICYIQLYALHPIKCIGCLVGILSCSHKRVLVAATTRRVYERKLHQLQVGESSVPLSCPQSEHDDEIAERNDRDIYQDCIHSSSASKAVFVFCALLSVMLSRDLSDVVKG